MKKLALVALVLAAVTAGTTAADAGGPGGTATLTIVHAATYDAGDDLPVTVCADGALVDDDFRVGEVLSDEGPAGPIQVDIFLGAGEACSGTGDISEIVSLPDGADVVAVASWTSEGPAIDTYNRPALDCVDPGNAQVAAFHAADVGTVDVYASPAGDPPSGPPAIPGFEENTFAGPLTVPAATVDFAIFGAGADPSGTPAVAVPGVTLAEGTRTTIYAIGGNDGDPGAFAVVDQLGVCAVATTTTTSTTTTTEVATRPADAARPVAGAPAYTG